MLNADMPSLNKTNYNLDSSSENCQLSIEKSYAL
jgi:hypothetical protein